MTRTVVIGAGPAGLTAAHELLDRTGHEVVVVEASDVVGGISCTVEHHGNRIDIGGHRFFSKSDRVMSWWLDRLPLEVGADDQFRITYQGSERELAARDERADPRTTDDVMLVRERTSRILWGGRLFDYPLSLSTNTLRSLGLQRATRSGMSYLRSTVDPVAREDTLEDFLVNRFGRELYETFFKSYTEKVWGVACDEIPAEWGAQRIKGLSIRRALTHAWQQRGGGNASDLAQRDVETSLVERFLYPKLGPGQLWEKVTDEVREAGGEVRMRTRAVGLERDGDRLTHVVVEDVETGATERLAADVVFSSMPLPHLVDAIGGAPDHVRRIAQDLPFRDFFTVGLLVDRLALSPSEPWRELIPDNWIYVQEPHVRLGRLQVFNNWSPWLVADPTKVWLGLEYFCNRDEPIWSRPDDELALMAASELVDIGVIRPGVVRDWTVLRVPRTYPAYFGSYDRIDEVTRWLQGFDNLWCVGRNGQHRYNNQDHSMLTSLLAVDVLAGDRAADDVDVWAVNTEQDYHEERS